MSTKCSLAYNGPGYSGGGPDDFHLYAECFDDKSIYLEMEGPDINFEASSGRIMVAIPLQIWEVIRHYSNIDLSLADKTDEELRADSEKFVKDRLDALQANKNGMVAAMGSVVYGAADETVEQQIQNGFDYHVEERRKQRELRDKIKSIQDKQRKQPHD